MTLWSMIRWQYDNLTMEYYHPDSRQVTPPNTNMIIWSILTGSRLRHRCRSGSGLTSGPAWAERWLCSGGGESRKPWMSCGMFRSFFVVKGGICQVIATNYGRWWFFSISFKRWCPTIPSFFVWKWDPSIAGTPVEMRPGDSLKQPFYCDFHGTRIPNNMKWLMW